MPTVIGSTLLGTIGAAHPGPRGTALTGRKDKGLHSSAPASKELRAPGEDLIERLGPERGVLRHVSAHLLHVFLPALLDLLLEELRKRTIPQPLLASRGMV